MAVDERGESVTDGTPAVDKEKPKPKGKVSPLRNVIGVVLLLGISGAGIMEVMANRAYTSAVTKLEKRMPTDETDPKDKNATLPTPRKPRSSSARAPTARSSPRGRSKRACIPGRG